MFNYMALRISENNLTKLSIVNGGLEPSELAIGGYFVFPYDYDSHCEILSEVDFQTNFRFSNTENVDCFVDCERLV